VKRRESLCLESPFLGSDDNGFTMQRVETSFDNQKTIRYDISSMNQGVVSYDSRHLRHATVDKNTFQILSELQNQQDDWVGEEGMPEIVNMSDSSQIIANNTFRRTIDKQNELNPFASRHPHLIFSDEAHEQMLLPSPSDSSSADDQTVVNVLGQQDFNEL